MSPPNDVDLIVSKGNPWHDENKNAFTSDEGPAAILNGCLGVVAGREPALW